MPRPKPERPQRRYQLALDADVADSLDRLAERHRNLRGDPSPSNAVAWLVRDAELREAVERAKAGGKPAP